MTGDTLRQLRTTTLARRNRHSTAVGAAAVPTHLTQVEAAKVLGIHVLTYARYERGQNRIPLPIEKLAHLILRGEIDTDL